MKLSQIPSLDTTQIQLMHFGRLFWIEDEDTGEPVLVQSVVIFDLQIREARWVNIVIPQLLDRSGHLPFYKFVNSPPKQNK